MSGLALVPVSTDVTTAAQIEAERRAITAASAEFRRRRRQPNTLDAYASDWQHFAAYCQRYGRAALPAAPETVADYLSYCAAFERFTVSTIARRLTAISVQHRMSGKPSPRSHETVQATFEGIRKVIGDKPPGQKEPSRWYLTKAMLGTIEGDGLAAVRDRAMVLVGFGGAFRRSEVVGLDRADVRFELEGVRLTLRRSKTDTTAKSRDVVIPYAPEGEPCPVVALRRWLDASGITEGPIFVGVDRWGKLRRGRLQPRHVATVVKRCADALGLDPALFAGHSLRSGHITSAAVGGAREDRIADTSGHKNRDTLARYTRPARAFADASAGFAMRDVGGAERR